jgi:hypothetical protein
MKFIGSAVITLVVLVIADAALNDERFARRLLCYGRQPHQSGFIFDGVLAGG